MEKETSGILSEMLKSIKFCWDSKKGKYSLKTYLDIIGEYSDRQIIKAEEGDLKYVGGECSVKKSNVDSEILEFGIELYFINQDGESVKLEANRELPIKKFVSEDVEGIGTETRRFKIRKPGGEV